MLRIETVLTDMGKRMGKGLSPMQEAILEALPDDPRPTPDGTFSGGMRPTDVIEALGLPRTNASRASVSRSLARLCERGLVLAWQGMFAVGRGCRYTKRADGIEQ
jgi:DNA-binding MarR family transcriptional regulator